MKNSTKKDIIELVVVIIALIVLIIFVWKEVFNPITVKLLASLGTVLLIFILDVVYHNQTNSF